MKTKICICAVFLAITMGATSALALPFLRDIPAPTVSAIAGDYTGYTLTQPYGITPDGAYVTGTATNSSNAKVGFLYRVSDDITTTVSGGSINTAATGIGYTATGAIMVNGMDNGWNSVNISSDGGNTWSGRRYTNIGPYALGSFNTAAGVPSTTNSGGKGAVGNTYATVYHAVDGGAVYAVGVDSADALLIQPAYPTFPFPLKSYTAADKYAGGISSEGVAVGQRAGQNYVMRLDQTPNAAYFRALGGVGDNNGKAWDISDDGAWAVGNSSDGPGTWAYVKDLSDLTGAATKLPGLEGATYSYAYGISGDGSYAVGISNGTGLGEQAMLWDLTGPTPVATHLNTFFTDLGLMGDFTNLFKPYSVGVNANGEPVVSGRGYISSGAEVGWVATLPEPAGVVLLALGSLLLRRRR
ncbi:MAG: hypothetical protein QUV05_02240 [Phycisphaerae bacterium]|nr:hypothetical protein [Phycisphaerae bacterium]